MHEVQQLDQWSLWAHHNPRKCPCRGSGWLLSDYDTYHKCGLHFNPRLPHPEDDHELEIPIDNDLHMLRCQRRAYKYFLAVSRLTPAAMREACCRNGVPESPAEWVDAADAVADEIDRERAEEEAHARGYSCALEERLDLEAMAERFERGGY